MGSILDNGSNRNNKKVSVPSKRPMTQMTVMTLLMILV
jgi:hypothetical protein